MVIEQEPGRRAVLFAGAALGVAWVSGGCTDDDEKPPDLPSVRYADAKLEAGFQEMYGHLSPDDRAVLDDEIMKRKDVLGCDSFRCRRKAPRHEGLDSLADV